MMMVVVISSVLWLYYFCTVHTFEIIIIPAAVKKWGILRGKEWQRFNSAHTHVTFYIIIISSSLASIAAFRGSNSFCESVIMKWEFKNLTVHAQPAVAAIIILINSHNHLERMIIVIIAITQYSLYHYYSQRKKKHLFCWKIFWGGGRRRTMLMMIVIIACVEGKRRSQWNGPCLLLLSLLRGMDGEHKQQTKKETWSNKF